MSQTISSIGSNYPNQKATIAIFLSRKQQSLTSQVTSLSKNQLEIFSTQKHSTLLESQLPMPRPTLFNWFCTIKVISSHEKSTHYSTYLVTLEASKTVCRCLSTHSQLPTTADGFRLTSKPSYSELKRVLKIIKEGDMNKTENT